MNATLRATAFHARTAEANRSNSWVTRNGVTLAATYSNPVDEALAARTRVAIADLGARSQLMVEGPRSIELLQKLLTRDVTTLSPSVAFKALWLADGGGVRGAAVVARYGKEAFWLLSAAPDRAWITAAAALFDVSVRDISTERNGIAIVGPYAHATLEAAGIQADLNLLAFRKVSWRGLEVTLSRFGEHGGYEVWCNADDGIIAWDRIVQAGTAFGLEPAGVAAMDILDIETGIPRPNRDYIPATDGDATNPSPWELGFDSLIDVDHATFNGRRNLMQSQEQETRRLIGVQIESDQPAPHTPLNNGSRAAGHTLSSCYSPSLRRAIALAQVEASSAKPGTRLTVTLPPCLQSPEFRVVPATVADLPFLERPDSVAG